MAQRVKIEGLRELDAALGELPKATGKNVLRRVLRKAAEPIAADMRAKAPDDPDTGGDDLRSSIGVGSKLSRRQAGLHRKMFRDDRASVEIFAGAGALPQAITSEWGTGPRHKRDGTFVGEVRAQPFARPAWDANKRAALDTVASELGDEILKAAKRLARKAARATK
jgi:HK97 gp10 family phage protein